VEKEKGDKDVDEDEDREGKEDGGVKKTMKESGGEFIFINIYS